MKQRIIPAGGGEEYDWSNDHMYVKSPMELSEGRVTVVEDVLKPGFDLARHYHKRMTEIFYILEGEVTFTFDDETEPLISTPGTTVNIPPHIWHRVGTKKGAKLLTIFSPGGFERYLSELAPLTNEQFADESLMRSMSEKYDSWTR